MMGKIENKMIIFVLLSLVAGISIGWIDTQPGWDDTGITIGLIFISSFILGLAAQKGGWLFGAVIGLCITLMNFFTSGKLDSAISILIAFAGVYGGVTLKYLIRK